MWKSVGWHRQNVRYCSRDVWADLERERDFSGDLINMRLIITPTSSALGKRFSKIPWIRATILTGSGRGSRGECGRHIIDSTVQSSTLHFVMFVSSLALVGRSSEMIYNGAHYIARAIHRIQHVTYESKWCAQLPLMFFVPASFKLTLHRRRSLTRVLTT